MAFRTTHPARLVLLLLFMLPLLTARAQSPTWQWATSAGLGTVYAAKADSAGNVYVAGDYFNSVTFGATTLVSAGSQDGFVAKRSPAGTWLWAMSLAGTQSEILRDLSLDAQGNAYLTGNFNSATVRLGPIQLANQGLADLVVAKISRDGIWQWAVSAAGAGSDYGSGISTERNGTAYVAGHFDTPTLSVGAATLTNAGSKDILVACISAGGVWQWAQRAGGPDDDEASGGIVYDGTGSVYLAGSFRDTASFGPFALTSAGVKDGWVASLTTTGAWQWTAVVTGPQTEDVRAVAVDDAGNPYVTGFFNSPTAAFGSLTATNVDPSTRDMFVACLTPGGLFQWVRAAGGTGSAEAASLIARAGNVYVTGNYSSNPVAFGSTQLLNLGRSDVYVAALTSAGNWRWTIGAGSASSEGGYALCLARNSQLLVGGSFFGPSLTFGPHQLTGVATGGMFLAGLSIPTGVPSDAPALALTLSPNPAHETVRLTGSTAPTADIIDALGRTVRTADLAPGTSTLNLAGLPPGLYTVRAGTATRRLVVE